MSNKFLFIFLLIATITGFGFLLSDRDRFDTDIQTVNLKSGDFFFIPNTVKAKEGQTLEFNIENSGMHTFVINELNLKKVLNEGKNSFKLKFDRRGMFTFYCDVAGHREAGQFGTL